MLHLTFIYTKMPRCFYPCLLTASLTGILTGVVGSPIAQAVQLADGTTQFVQPPRLVGATATQKAARFPGSTYFFTLNHLETAGEPLQKVTFVQEVSVDTVRFDPKRTEAFEGTFERSGAQLRQTSMFDRQTRTMTVIFDPPVPPGKTVTIGLNAIRNPISGGVYLYGVTAFPTGDKPYGQFLGYGRISIYDSGLDSLLHPFRYPDGLDVR
jgi:hypothetical protein